MIINHTSPYSFHFEETTLPKTTNGMTSMHWTMKHKERSTWNNIVMYHAMKQGVPPKPLEHAELTLTRFSSYEPDFDGLVSSFKYIIDSLIGNGILINDRKENIGVPNYKWEKVPPKKGKIRVEVIEKL